MENIVSSRYQLTGDVVRLCSLGIALTNANIRLNSRSVNCPFLITRK